MAEALAKFSAAPFLPFQEASLGGIDAAPPGEVAARQGGLGSTPADRYRRTLTAPFRA